MFPGMSEAMEKLGLLFGLFIGAIDRHTEAINKNTAALEARNARADAVDATIAKLVQTGAELREKIGTSWTEIPPKPIAFDAGGQPIPGDGA